MGPLPITGIRRSDFGKAPEIWLMESFIPSKRESSSVNRKDCISVTGEGRSLVIRSVADSAGTNVISSIRLGDRFISPPGKPYNFYFDKNCALVDGKRIETFFAGEFVAQSVIPYIHQVSGVFA